LAHRGNALYRWLYVADLIAAGYDHRNSDFPFIYRRRQRPSDNHLHETKPPKTRQPREKIIHYGREQRNPFRKYQQAVLANGTKTGELEKIADVVFTDPVWLDES